MKKLSYSLCLLLLFSRCASSYLLTTPNGFNITKKAKFNLKDKFQLGDTSLLSPTKLYVLSCYNGWFKFYSNGRILYNDNLKIPKTESDKIGGLGGYYKLDGNKIEIELSYAIKNGINDWSWLVMKGDIVGDTLKFYKTQIAGIGRNTKRFTNIKDVSNGHSCYFIKSTESFFLRQVDW